jgi:putative membrane protein
MSKERILNEATFSRSAVTYHVVPLGILLCITIIGIPVALVIVPLIMLYYQAYYRRLRVILTSRDLKVHRGILNIEEKSIPLEKITDLAVFQGPIMRYFGLKGIRIETAGQSSGLGALVSVIGIEETDAFRDMVLSQRDRIADRDDADSTPPRTAASAPVASATSDGELLQTMRDVRDTLGRIEELLRNQK